MGTAEDQDAALLQEVLTGGREVTEHEVQAMFRRRPDLHARWQRLRALAQELDGVGRADREQRAIDLARPSPLEDLVRRTVERQLRPGRPMAWRWLAAALVLLAVAGAMWSLRERAADEGSTLGQAEGSLWPQGEVAAYQQFRWRRQLPAGCTFVIRFRQDGGDAILFESKPLTENSWQPTPQELQLLQPRMTWEVEILDVGGSLQPGGMGPVRVWLRR